ncbi:hypothetical protein TCAL_15030 [Tigriopus californicus]|uniref:Uncharacterized protein n=1 Tax=Tigriopus californicus TaxID=6832 RepID=A0A553P086_TIGCA|nr:uncharacterized protein LOC131886343 [Tigriopus californicus]XP_059090619.1 uncharacterized protein LOC131886343 [Tigriopus californicus]TRY71101.1 hypothetical protein TCAL_15030 [Tigriopus californicus]
MVLANASLHGGGQPDLPIYYKEIPEKRRVSRFCIKPVETYQPRGGGTNGNSSNGTATDKRGEAINVQVVRGKTNTFIHLDEDEAKKVRKHGDEVLKKLQKIHKSVIWNFLIGRSFVDKIQKGKQGTEEINLDHDENSEFDALNPKTWSEDSTDFLASLLKASEFPYDGYVVLFCVANDLRDGSVDYDELAWELEKCLTYHYVQTKGQLIMNEEAIMSRKGLDPVSRKTKTPGRKKSGYCIFLAYQLLDSVTQDQIVGEAINKYVDIGQKKKLLLSALTEEKLFPQNDERLRKNIKEMKEFMSKEHLDLVYKIGSIKDAESLEMVVQFLNLVGKGPKDRNSGFMGLPQFLSFLSSNKDDTNGSMPGMARSNSRMSNLASPKVQTRSTLPRPSSSRQSVQGLPSSRKPSIATSNQTFSISSRSTTPETPRKLSGESLGHSQRKESSLPSIPSSGSGSSTPETLRRQEHQASTSRHPPKPMSSLPKRNAAKTASPSPIKTNGTRPRPIPTTRNVAHGRKTASESPRGTPPKVGSARSSVNGDNSNRNSPSSSLTNSPRMSKSVGPRRGSRQTPPPGKIITRDDLRRMNRSYPSSKSKPSGSFSRTSIPMS